MRDPIHTVSASPSRSPYPVSIRSYKKKDYDYLASFPRMTHPVLSATRSDAALSQERSDCESDLSMTTSSVGYATSTSSASTRSSVYETTLISATDAEVYCQHDHHQQQPHQQHFLSTETCTHSPRISVDCTESVVEMTNDKKDDSSSADVKEDKSADVKEDKSNITGDSPAPIEMASAQVKVPGRSQSKPKPRAYNTPAVLPKFGSWDTRNPSSGEAYTLIFRRLRDEKKSGGLPLCTSPTHSKEDGPEESLSQESKPKEPLHPKPRMRKDSSRQKAKGKSHQEDAYNRKNVMVRLGAKGVFTIVVKIMSLCIGATAYLGQGAKGVFTVVVKIMSLCIGATAYLGGGLPSPHA